MNQQTRYTQVHLEVGNQGMDLSSMKAGIFRSLIREYTHFVQNVEIGCVTDLCSDPKQSKTDLSLFCGSGSYIYLYLRMHTFFSSLTQEEIGFYQEKALNHLADEKMNEFFNPHTYLDLAEKQQIALCSVAGMMKDQNISFCFSNYSLYVFQAQIAYIKRDIKKFKSAVQQILHYKDLILKKPDHFENELLYGIPGYVYMLLLLQKQYGADHIEPEFKISLKQEIYQLCNKMVDKALVINYQKNPGNLLQKILNNQIQVDSLQLAVTFGKRNYFGAAHGALGVIQILLLSYELCQDYFTQPNNDKFTEIMFSSIIGTLDYLIGIFNAKQNIPSSYQNIDSLKLYQFCHGIIGAISPLLKTAKFKNKPDYIGICKKMVDEIWKYGVLKKGYGLCHGIPGNAYPFMQLYQVTNEPQLLEKAYVFLQYKMNQKIMEQILNFDFNDRLNKGISDHPFSLMLGSVGDMSAMMDFLKYEGMPAYEV